MDALSLSNSINAKAKIMKSQSPEGQEAVLDQIKNDMVKLNHSLKSPVTSGFLREICEDIESLSHAVGSIDGKLNQAINQTLATATALLESGSGAQATGGNAYGAPVTRHKPQGATAGNVYGAAVTRHKPQGATAGNAYGVAVTRHNTQPAGAQPAPILYEPADSRSPATPAIYNEGEAMYEQPASNAQNADQYDPIDIGSEYTKGPSLVGGRHDVSDEGFRAVDARYNRKGASGPEASAQLKKAVSRRSTNGRLVKASFFNRENEIVNDKFLTETFSKETRKGLGKNGNKYKGTIKGDACTIKTTKPRGALHEKAVKIINHSNGVESTETAEIHGELNKIFAEFKRNSSA